MSDNLIVRGRVPKRAWATLIQYYHSRGIFPRSQGHLMALCVGDLATAVEVSTLLPPLEDEEVESIIKGMGRPLREDRVVRAQELANALGSAKVEEASSMLDEEIAKIARKFLVEKEEV